MNFRIQTGHPVALESYDHLYPLGTIQDNHSNSTLVQKLKELKVETLLDIGCAGGGFVEELLENGIQAVGIEGSDISQKMGRAAWGRIPENLFTADVTKPFAIYKTELTIKFNVITAWEFFEHILEEDLWQLFYNIRVHSKLGTLLICSIANFPSPHQGVDLHRTQKDLDFWLKTFEKYGFDRDEEIEKFLEGNYVRYGSYNLVLRRNR